MLLCSERIDCSESGEVDERLLLRLLPEAGELFEYDCSSTTDEPLSSRLLPEVAGAFEWSCSELLLLSSKVGADISLSEMVLLFPNICMSLSPRRCACITGLKSFSKAKGLKEETKTS